MYFICGRRRPTPEDNITTTFLSPADCADTADEHTVDAEIRPDFILTLSPIPSVFHLWKICGNGHKILSTLAVSYKWAIQPISTLQFLGSVLTATVSRAGGSSPK